MLSARPVVVLGATGTVGREVSLALAGDVPLVLAGRDEAALHALREAVLRHVGDAVVQVVTLDVTERAATVAVLREAAAVAHATPHTHAAFEACLDASVPCADVSFAPARVMRAVRDFDARAREAGVALVPACATHAALSDAAVHATVSLLPRDADVTVEAWVSQSAELPHAARREWLDAMESLRENVRAMRPRGAIERAVRSASTPVGFDPALAAWTRPLPSPDVPVVLRSAALDARFTRSFTYAHGACAPSPVDTVGALAGLGLDALLTRFDRTRAWRASRTSETPAVFAITLRARAGGRTVETAARLGARSPAALAGHILAACARSLATRASRPGVGTPASSLGDALPEGLTRAGFAFEVRRG